MANKDIMIPPPLCVDGFSTDDLDVYDITSFRNLLAQRTSSSVVTNVIPPRNVALSVEELVRIAASKFILSHSNDSSFHLSTTLSDSESDSVELAQLLLQAAEKVGRGDSAETFIDKCEMLSSPSGTPIQRLVFYYSRALRVRIGQEIGGIVTKDQSPEEDLYKVVMTPSFRFVEFHRRIPFSPVAQFAGIQSIVEHVEKSQNIHVIDFGIRNGHQWTILMQALASRKRRRVKHLKITAVATLGKHLIEQRGNMLLSFAQAMNLPCSFHVVMVHDLTELRHDHFKIEPEEAVAVLAEYIINTLTEPVERIDLVIRAIRSLYPIVMVVTEMEVNMNSPVFVNRFVESLFFASAYFDCFEDCMDRDEEARVYGESMLFGEGSKVVVAEERSIRNMKADVWRIYFKRVGMVEEALSQSSLYQVGLVVKKVPCWSQCTFGTDEKSLIVGWKGTPILSVTAWKFC